MQLKTILNRVERYKSFVYEDVSWDERAVRPTLRVAIRERANGRPICSGCKEQRPGYDRLGERTWEFVPLWQIVVLFVYAPRRVDCPDCGVVVERVPWADGKCRQTKSYRWFLSRWAKRLSWQEVAEVFHTSWDTVYRAVRYAVMWGVVHREVNDVVAIGVDEIQWKRARNLTSRQTVKLKELLQYNLRTVRGYLLREDFQRFWEYKHPTWAGRFLREWCTRTMRSRLEPMKKVARTLREHESLLMNWFHAKGEISAGITEGLNNKAKLTMRKAYGFRSYEGIETALYHQLGHLPEPESTHRFC